MRWDNCTKIAAPRAVLATTLGLIVAIFSGGIQRAAAEQEAATSPAPEAERDPAKASVDPPQAAPDELVWVIQIRLPIDGQVFESTRRSVLRARDRSATSGQRPVFVFEMFVPEQQSEYGRGSEFGASYQLANFFTSKDLSGARTVAFVPQSIEGHAVLPVLACDDIIMAPGAELGPAGVDESAITRTIRSAYREIADRRKLVPAEIAEGLVDPKREVLKVQTETGTVYVDRAGLATIEQEQLVLGKPEVIIAAGRPAKISGTEARKLGIATYLADSLDGVADAIQVPRKALRMDPSLGDQWRAVRIDVTGPISSNTAEQFVQQVQRAIEQQNANFLCVWIDSPGGDLDASLRMADYLAHDIDPYEVRSVAYIPNQALADAALVAMACDDVVMAPSARLGGEGAAFLSPEDVEIAVGAVRESIADAKGRTWSLPAALISPDIEVFRMTRLGDVRYQEFLSEEERKSRSAPDQWERGPRVTTPGRPLSVKGDEAVDFWLADDTATDFNEFKSLYGLENDPSLLRPGWADTLIRAMASPGIAGVLLLIGFLALYGELKTPGLGIGGFVSATCFMLFFWSRFLGGTAGWLEVLLFLTGVVCLLLEIFILPGFGIFGLGGGLLILGSIVLAGQTFVIPRNAYQFTQFQNSLGVLAVSGLGAIFLMMSFGRWLQRFYTPSLEEQEAQRTREALVHYESLLGQQGRTVTRLSPAGKARIGDKLVDVLADCELLESGTDVEVVLVQGNRVFVRPLSPAS